MYGSHLLIQLVGVELVCLSFFLKKKGGGAPQLVLTHSQGYRDIWGILRDMAREGNGNPLQYSCLENPMDRGAW